jgi:hypothetical protein
LTEIPIPFAIPVPRLDHVFVAGSQAAMLFAVAPPAVPNSPPT